MAVGLFRRPTFLNLELNQKQTVMKKIFIRLSALIALSMVMLTCSRNDADQDTERNNEVVVYKKPPSTASQKSTSATTEKTLNLRELLKEVSIIRYENDILDDVRDQREWIALSRDFSIDKRNIKKSTIEGSEMVVISIPFKSKIDSGFFNLYKTGTKIRYSKMSVLKRSNGRTNYNVTMPDKGQILDMDLDKDMKIYDNSPNINVSSNKKAGSTVITADPPPPPKLDCFKPGLGYFNCIKCLIQDHCGQDGVCFLACLAFPEACVAIAMVACLPD